MTWSISTPCPVWRLLWTREQLTAENMEWLRALPRGPIHMRAWRSQFVHGSPLDEDEYVVSDGIRRVSSDGDGEPLRFLDTRIGKAASVWMVLKRK